jgi:uncharacterized membrane protein
LYQNLTDVFLMMPDWWFFVFKQRHILGIKAGLVCECFAEWSGCYIYPGGHMSWLISSTMAPEESHEG